MELKIAKAIIKPKSNQKIFFRNLKKTEFSIDLAPLKLI